MLHKVLECFPTELVMILRWLFYIYIAKIIPQIQGIHNEWDLHYSKTYYDKIETTGTHEA